MEGRTRLIAARLLGQAASGRIPASGPRLLVVAGPEAGRSHPVSDGDTLGRGASSQVPLPDPAASRRHARVEQRDGRLTIVDLGSKNGVELNGRPLRTYAPLRDGDRVRVGATLLEAAGFASDAPAAAAEEPAADPLPRDAQLVRAAAATLLAAGAALVAAYL